MPEQSGQQDLLGQQTRLGHQAAHQPPVGLLLALERQDAVGQQHRDEQQRDRDEQHDGEVVQCGALPVDDRPSSPSSTSPWAGAGCWPCSARVRSRR